jgi:hypothetical protein
MKFVFLQLRVLLIAVMLAATGVLAAHAANFGELSASGPHAPVVEMHGTNVAGPASVLASGLLAGHRGETCKGGCCSNCAGCGLCTAVIVGTTSDCRGDSAHLGQFGRIAADSMLVGHDPEAGQRPPQHLS